MAASDAEVVAVAEAMISVATKLKEANVIMSQALANNSAHSIDWTLQATKDVLEDHPTSPTAYTAAEVSNVIGSFATFGSAFWDAGHSQNIELLTPPIV